MVSQGFLQSLREDHGQVFDITTLEYDPRLRLQICEFSVNKAESGSIYLPRKTIISLIKSTR